jgi:selenophosphate synthetase-related protein
MKEIFERLFSLIKKTGDRVVFYDSAKGDAYVMMKIEDYEKIRENAPPDEDLTNFYSPDKIEKINQDIAMWREEVKEVKDVAQGGFIQREGEIPEKEEEENQFYFEPVE